MKFLRPTLLLLFAVFLLSSKPDKEDKTFYGTLIYKVTVGGESDNVRFMDALYANEIKVLITKDGYRQMEKGGAQTLDILYNKKKNEIFSLNNDEKSYTEISVERLQDEMDAVKEKLPHIYQPLLAKDNDLDTIMDFPCRLHKISKAKFMDAGGVTNVWLSDSLNVPNSQYIFNTGNRKITTPHPLYIGAEKGIVLKMEIQQKDHTITYELTTVTREELSSTSFKIPKEYEAAE